MTFECAGNGRANVTPRWQTQPWEYGAVGTAEWTGTPLRHLLERAGLERDAVEVAFLGIDRGFDAGREHEFGRSLTPDAAMDDDVLLVWAMNGVPLLPQHGFPLRLIVPGWYGMASVKWLNRIDVLAQPFDGYQQRPNYHYRQKRGEPGVPVTTMRVKSLMMPPGIPDWYTRHRVVEAGPVELTGRAWSGAGVPIARVAVGSRWNLARRRARSAAKANIAGAAGASTGKQRAASMCSHAARPTPTATRSRWSRRGTVSASATTRVQRVHVTVR